MARLSGGKRGARDMRLLWLRMGTAWLSFAVLLFVGIAQADPEKNAKQDTTSPAPVVVREGTPIADDPPPRAPRTTPRAPVATSPVAHRCFVREVAAFYDRTHIRCHNAADRRLVYFGVDTAQPVAETLLVKAWRSMRSGKPLRILYAPTPDLNPPNCKPTNCRRLLDAAN